MKELTRAKFINLTSHEVIILEPEVFKFRELNPKVKVIYPRSGMVARARYRTELVERFIDQEGNLIEVTNTQYYMETPLPPPQPGVFYIVSKIIAELHEDTRNDLLIVSGKLFDKRGVLIGVKGLAFLKHLKDENNI